MKMEMRIWKNTMKMKEDTLKNLITSLRKGLPPRGKWKERRAVKGGKMAGTREYACGV